MFLDSSQKLYYWVFIMTMCRYWQTAGEREGENPMKTPLPYIIIFGMSTPFIILALGFLNGWIKVPIRWLNQSHFYLNWAYTFRDLLVIVVHSICFFFYDFSDTICLYRLLYACGFWMRKYKEQIFTWLILMFDLNHNQNS